MKHNNMFPDHNVSRPLQPPKYRVYYLVNNDNINIKEDFVVDNNTYNNGDEVQLNNFDNEKIYFSPDGIIAYRFEGWSFRSNGNIINTDKFNIPNHDVKLYAQWKTHEIFSVNMFGSLAVNKTFEGINIAPLVPSIILPEYLKGGRIKLIGGTAFSDFNSETIVIPPSVTTIQGNAFETWSGKYIEFIDVPVSDKYPALTLEQGCFDTTPNLLELVLPYRWRLGTYDGTYRLITNEGTMGEKTGAMNIYIRNTQNFMESTLTVPPNLEGTDEYITDTSQLGSGFVKSVHWGYND